MILAAGLGTRLRPITRHTPKALISIGGMTLLERVIRRLSAAGADRIIVNVHHRADLIEEFLHPPEGEGTLADVAADILVSREDDGPLETGGGLVHAAHLFRHETPFYLHNVDLVTGIDLGDLYRSHVSGSGLATLAVQERRASRFLLFDDVGLYGRRDESTGREERARDARGEPRALGFTGVHVVSPDIFGLLTERGTFSIIDAYLRLAAAGHRILPHDVSDALWLEIGTPALLRRARAALGGEQA